MYQIQLDKAPVFSSVDAILNNLALLRMQTHQAETFGEHLQRAQTRPDGPAFDDPVAASATDTPRETAPETPPAADEQRREDREADVAEPEENGVGRASDDAPSNRNADTTDHDGADLPNRQDQQPGDDAESAEAGSEIGIEPLPENIAAEIPAETTGPAAGKDEASQDGSGQQKVVPTEGLEDPAASQKTPQDQSPQQTASEQPATMQAQLDDGDRSAESPAEDRQTAVQQQDHHDDLTSESVESETEAATGVEDNSASRQGEKAAATAGQPQQFDPQTPISNRPRRSRDRSERKPTIPDRVEGPAAAASPQTSTATETTTARSANPQAASVEPGLAIGELKADAAEGAAKPVSSGSSDSQSNLSARGEPAGGSKTGSTQTSQKAAGAGQIDRARFVQRVARAFRTIADRSGTVRLRLSPPELGSLRLEISVRNGLMTANVEAETPAARKLLLDNLPALRERLAQQDIKVEQFNVDLSGRSPGGSPDQTTDHANSRQQDGGRMPHADVEPDEEAGPSEAGGPSRVTGEGTQLNIVI